MSKKLRVRTCVGCGRRAGQDELLRLAVDSKGRVAPDSGRPAPGRGGYLHHDAACWDRFASRKGLVRSLGRVLSRTERQVLVARLRNQSEL